MCWPLCNCKAGCISALNWAAPGPCACRAKATRCASIWCCRANAGSASTARSRSRSRLATRSWCRMARRRCCRTNPIVRRCHWPICGLCSFDGSHPLLQALPRRIVLRAADSIGEGWLADALRYMSYEANAGRPGGGAVIGRLADILLIQAVRAELNRSDATSGFLAALKQPAIGRALQGIHARPADDWTIDSLAREAGIS